MKIVYIHQYFKTPEEGGAIRSYHLAKKLLEAGHYVEMVTARNVDRYNKKIIEDIIVHYLPVSYHNHYGFGNRIFSFIKFVLLAFRLIKGMDKVDLIYATSTPLTVGLLALRLKKRLGIPYLFEVRDLWPDAPIEMGIIKNRIFKRRLRRLEKNIYDNSEGIVALSPPVKTLIESRTKNKVFLIPNFADVEFFNNNQRDEELAKSLEINSHFIVVYTGAVGKANRLENLLKLAMACSIKQLLVKFLIIGEGAGLNQLKIECANRGLTNVLFVPQQNKTNLRKYLHLADAAYISFDKPTILETSSPNKLFDALASGKLIVYNKKGWIKDLIENYDCGFYADPENPEFSSEKLSSFMQNPQKLKLFKQNAIKTADLFSKEKLLGEYIQMITSISKQNN